MVHSQGPSEQRAVNNLWLRNRGRIQGCRNFLGTPYYLRNGLSYGLLTRLVHLQSPSEQNAVNNLWQKESWAYPGAAEIFRYPLLSQERVKLRTSNSAGTFAGSIRTKGHLKFVAKGSVGVSRGCPKFLGTPIISGTGEATDS